MRATSTPTPVPFLWLISLPDGGKGADLGGLLTAQDLSPAKPILPCPAHQTTVIRLQSSNPRGERECQAADPTTETSSRILHF